MLFCSLYAPCEEDKQDMNGRFLTGTKEILSFWSRAIQICIKKSQEERIQGFN